MSIEYFSELEKIMLLQEILFKILKNINKHTVLKKWIKNLN